MLASIVLNYAFAMLIELPGYGSKPVSYTHLHPAHQCRETPQAWGRKTALGENGNRKHFNLFDLWEEQNER